MNCDNGYVVPPAQWKWCGYAGHFIAADSCRFRMCTQVGDWLISSVGDMLDSKGKRQRIGAGEDAYFETCVFKAGPICSVRGCGCGQPTIDGHELDSRRCGTGGEAQALHMAFCEKYARGGTPEDDTSMTKETSNDPRTVLLQLCASLTLSDHMGDVAEDVQEALKRIGVRIEWSDWPELAKALHKMGVKTLWGTAVGGDDDE